MMDRALAGPLYPAVPCEPEMLTRPLRDYCQIIIAIAIDTFRIYGCHLFWGGPDEDQLALPQTVWYLRQPLGIKVQSYDDPTNDCSSGLDMQCGLGFVLCMRHKRL